MCFCCLLSCHVLGFLEVRMFSAFRELWLLVGGPEPTAVASARETQTVVARPYEFREGPLV